MKTSFFISCLILSSVAISQENTVSSGGTATGGNGSATYSVGQVFYAYVNGSNATLNQGVQQPLELFTASVVESTLVSLAVYPNPTVQQLTIAFDEQPQGSYSYALFDYQGKLLLTEKVTEKQTTIDLAEFAVATYLLRVMDHQKTVAVVEIIKN